VEAEEDDEDEEEEDDDATLDMLARCFLLFGSRTRESEA
jgi:hypothetical protein